MSLRTAGVGTRHCREQCLVVADPDSASHWTEEVQLHCKALWEEPIVWGVAGAASPGVGHFVNFPGPFP